MDKQTILVVDDEPDILELVEYNLQKEGYEVHTAENGHAALKKAAKVRPDLVLLDVMMPGLDGPACLEQLRQDPRTRELPVIFLTAKGDAAELLRLQELSGRPSLRKPFDPTTLADELRAILAG